MWLYRYTPDFSIIEEYDLKNNKWIDWYENDEETSGYVVGNSQARVPFKMPLPSLDPKYNYQIMALPRDIFGREGQNTFLFNFQSPSSPSTRGSSASPSAGSS